jgi:hypothetical protein
MWAESAVCSSSSQCDLRTSPADAVEGGRCVRCQCRCGRGQFDE